MLVTLNNGIQMPQIGLGVWRVQDGQQVEQSVLTALETGYRHIDTAAVYKNEEGVGKALKASGLAREDVFVTTKIWNSDQGYDTALQAYDASLNKLGLDYVDLYLVHWPTPERDLYVETYKALEKLYADGRVRAIGVSNFHIHHLERLMQETNIVPAVNQVECHPRLQQHELRTFCKQHGIYLTAWSPLMQGGDILQHETILTIAKHYNKTAAQVIIRWHLQIGNIVIPKSITPARIGENFDVFDFELSADDMVAIGELNQDKRVGPDPQDMNVY